MTDLDPRWEWTTVRTWDGSFVNHVRGRCKHLETVPVVTGGEVVARLCLTCDQQLPALGERVGS